MPAEKGDVRNLTRTAGVAERDPSWSPDGKWIAYFSDESGEYALHLRDQKGLGEVKKIGLGNPASFFYSPVWSPDSKKIAYSDKRLNVWHLDIEKGVPVKFDTLSRGLGLNLAWSPDSRWITYTKPLKSWYSAVFVYSVEESKVTQITDGLSDAGHPVFDASGKYLYFTASTDIGPRVFGFDMSSYPHRSTRSVYVCVLKKDLPSPLAPESDDEKSADEKKKDEKKDDKSGDKAPREPKKRRMAIRQTLKLIRKPTLPASRATRRRHPRSKWILTTSASGSWRCQFQPATMWRWLLAKRTCSSWLRGRQMQVQGGATLHKFDLEKRKLDKVADKINAFEISANGEKMLYRQEQNWFIASGSQPVKPGEGKLKMDEMEVFVDPREEWKQMSRETWRIERDFFYDPNHHGLDLARRQRSMSLTWTP